MKIILSFEKCVCAKIYLRRCISTCVCAKNVCTKFSRFTVLYLLKKVIKMICISLTWLNEKGIRTWFHCVPFFYWKPLVLKRLFSDCKGQPDDLGPPLSLKVHQLIGRHLVSCLESNYSRLSQSHVINIYTWTSGCSKFLLSKQTQKKRRIKES